MQLNISIYSKNKKVDTILTLALNSCPILTALCLLAFLFFSLSNPFVPSAISTSSFSPISSASRLRFFVSLLNLTLPLESRVNPSVEVKVSWNALPARRDSVFGSASSSSSLLESISIFPLASSVLNFAASAPGLRPPPAFVSKDPYFRNAYLKRISIINLLMILVFAP